MTDVLSSEDRHRNMVAIKGKNTKPEIMVRKYLFSKGYRYRKNDKRYPGHPDIVLPKYHTVIFVNGCFWHGHDRCKYLSVPKTNTKFWEEKISKNKSRDEKCYRELTESGWNVIIVWECELKTEEKRKTRFQQLETEISGNI